MASPATTNPGSAQHAPGDGPPLLRPGDRVVLFDGVCRLCSAWARFLIQHDRDRRFALATVQSPEGQALLAWFGLRTAEFDTMVLVEDGQAHTRSDAFIRVMAQLPSPFRWATVLRWIPARLRDALYDRVARNRYRLFGQHSQCVLPTPDHDARFLRR